MKTKPIPAIVMLSAGFITCMMGIYRKMEFLPFAKTLLIVMLSFYLLGGVIAYVLEKNFAEIKEETEADDAVLEENEEGQEERENDESDEEKK